MLRMLRPIDMGLQAEIETECRKHPQASKPFHGFKVSTGAVAAGILAHYVEYEPVAIGMVPGERMPPTEVIEGTVSFLADHDPITHGEMRGEYWTSIDNPGLAGRDPRIQNMFKRDGGTKRCGCSIGAYGNEWFYISAIKPGILRREPRTLGNGVIDNIKHQILEALLPITRVNEITIEKNSWGGWEITAHTKQLGNITKTKRNIAHLPLQDIEEVIDMFIKVIKIRKPYQKRFNEFKRIAEQVVRDAYGNLVKVKGSTLINCFTKSDQDGMKPKGISSAQILVHMETLKDDLSFGIVDQDIDIIIKKSEHAGLKPSKKGSMISHTDVNSLQEKVEIIQMRYERAKKGIITSSAIATCLDRLGDVRDEILSRFFEKRNMRLMTLEDRKALNAVGIYELWLVNGIVKGNIRFSRNLKLENEIMRIRDVRLPDIVIDSLDGRSGTVIADHEALNDIIITSHRITPAGSIVLEVSDSTRRIG
jgi:hypothetical protein